MNRRLALPNGSESVSRLKAALEERPSTRVVRGEAIVGEVPRSDDARRFWSERAWSEFAAVPAMAQMTLALSREGASIEALDAIAIINRDEVRHTAVSRDLAERMGGYVDEIPEESAYQPQLLGEPYWVPFAAWVVSVGCISETVSHELMRARFGYTKHPVVRSALGGILKDEAMHSRLAWIMAEELIPALSEEQRRNLAEYGAAELEVLRSTFVTQMLPPLERARARKLRARVYDEGLGAAPPDVEDGVYDRVKSELIVPRLERLGVRIA
jgi:hypothetical protein